MKKIYALLLICVMLVSFCAGAVAVGNLEEIKALLNYGITVKYNGDVQTMYDAQGTRVYPITYNGTTYVPIRAVSNMLGIAVDWDGANNTVLLGENSKSRPEANKVLQRGVVNGKTYENSFLGLGFKVPDSWEYASDEEIEQIVGAYTGEDLQKSLEENGGYCDVFALDALEGTNINIMIEKKTELQKSMDFEEVYLNTITNLSEALKEVYDDADIVRDKFVLGGKSFLGFKIDGNIQGIPLFQYGFLIDLGDYVASVSMTASDLELLSDIMKMFYII